MGFTQAELEGLRGRTVPDLIGPRCQLLFVGINPGLWTAATQTHFCHPSNRFYPALRRGGLIDFEIDTGIGMTDQQRSSFVGAGLGITNLVDRATARAGELSNEELTRGGKKLKELVDLVQPSVVAVLGITAYRTAFGLPKARIGRQELPGPVKWWALPNPSGLNAHVTATGLAEWFAELAQVAEVT